MRFSVLDQFTSFGLDQQRVFRVIKFLLFTRMLLYPCEIISYDGHFVFHQPSDISMSIINARVFRIFNSSSPFNKVRYIMLCKVVVWLRLINNIITGRLAGKIIVEFYTHIVYNIIITIIVLKQSSWPKNQYQN